MLHLKRNPEAAALAKAEQSRSSALEAENTALKAQLQKLEEGQHAGPASVDSAVLEAQITLLQHKVKQHFATVDAVVPEAQMTLP